MEPRTTESRGPDVAPPGGRPVGLPGLMALVLAATLAAGCGGEADDDTAGAGSASGAAPMARSLGLSYMQSGDLEEAAEQFRRYIDAAPDAAFGYTNLGLVRLWQGRAAEAEEHVRRALEVAPEDPDVRLNLAAVLAATGRRDSARAVLTGTLSERPEHARTLYALAELVGEEDGTGAMERRAELLGRLVEAGPANLAARTALAETAARLGDAATAAEQLAAVRRQAPALPEEVTRRLDRAIRELETESPGDAVPAVAAFADRFELTTTYQTAAAELRGPRRDLPGAVAVDFTRTGTTGGGDEGPAVALRPADVLPDGGGPVGALDAADYDGDGDADLVVGGRSRGLRLLRNDGGRFVDAADSAGVAAGYRDAAGAGASGPTAVAFADVDNDGWLDLYVARPGRNLLFRNRGDGSFREAAASAGLTGPGGAGAAEALFLDLEHDGDLDLLLVGPFGQRAYRNDGDGSFTERTGGFGFDRETAGSAAAFADLDGDVDVDVVVARRHGPPLLYENRRGGRFREASARLGLDVAGPAVDVDVGDWDNDGDFDLALGPAGSRSVRLLENRGDGGFAPPDADAGLPASGPGGGSGPVRLVDLDNDGDLDLLSGGDGSGDAGLTVHVNRGGGEFRAAPEWTPEAVDGARALASLDYDGDADLDVAAGGGYGLRVLRNDGGSSNHQMMVRLTGLRAGGGKNNHFGVGARVEVRSGDSYQARMVTGPTPVHFGLGDRPRAEVARVQWPNGVPQTVYYASSDAGVAEEQTLKGSCVFLYTWDSDGYTFVTDVLWRSALGMPVGIMGGSGSRGRSYAPAAPSREYRRIPGEALRPRDGRYLLQLTEELWETAYVDEVRLVAVDRPDSVRVFLDERFVPAGRDRDPPGDRLHPVTDVRPPEAARDGEGRDLLPKLRRADDVYAAPFSPGPHQGVVSPHSIVLDAGDLASRRRPVLLLTGWVYPTDASINVAMAQNEGLSSRPPVLQVPDRDGGWRTVGRVGFPAGKAKTLVADLRPAVEAGADSVRIRTNMQVYWDRIAVASRVPGAPVRRSTLRPDSAHLHFRGYSREYRKGGRNGPFWFDYDDVSSVSRWRPTSGRYTRYGDVRELLTGADDMYVIMAQGDELTVAFDARDAPALPEGWSRDFMIYTEGWLKDADLNTATGSTVEPLPYHGMARYPYGPGAAGYPDDSAHRAYLRNYNTRVREPGLAPLRADSTPPVGVSRRRR